VEGSRNSVEIKEYDFHDTQAYQGVNYYRLQQTDFGGDYTYSEVVSVLMTYRAPITIYPNPVADWLYVSFEDTNQEIYLQDMMGRNVIAIEDNSRSQNTIKIKMQHLPKGMYFLKMNDTIHKVLKL
jgi:hypothetical protein